jgi:hypothetical protein
MNETPPAEILNALRRMHQLQRDGDTRGERLTGGVSSDIWRIDLPSGPICVKRALGKLRVEADWHAPVERNRYEARWMQRANAAVPGSAPRLLDIDEASGALAMQYLSPDDYPLWKTQLRDGDADPAFATQWHKASRASMPQPQVIQPSQQTSRPIRSSTTSDWNRILSQRRACIPNSHRN